MNYRSNLKMLFSLVTIAALDAPHQGYAQEPDAPLSASMSADQALQEALEIVKQLAEGGAEGGWEDVSQRMDRYMAIIEANDPSNPWVSYLYGWIYAIGGQKGDAIEQLQKFIETREGRNEWLAYRLLGDLLVEQFPRLARSYYKKASDLVDREPSVLYGQSRCAVATGDVAEAIRLAREAVGADRDGAVRYLSHLARMLIRDGRWSEARRAAETALERALSDHRSNPTMERPLRLADLQYQLLIEISRSQLNNAPNPEEYVRIVRYLDRRGEIAIKLQQAEIARLLEAAIGEPGGDSYVPLHELYGETLAKLGREEDAIRAFERVLELDPSNGVANQWLEKLRPEPKTAQPDIEGIEDSGD